MNRVVWHNDTMRASYHYAIRHVRKREEHIANDRFAEAIVWNKSRDFWNEVKRMKSSVLQWCYWWPFFHAGNLKLFHVKIPRYQDLYTSVSYDIRAYM